MSDYERKAWQALLAETADRGTPGRLEDVKQRMTARARDAATRARTAIGRVPGADNAIDAADKTIARAMEGLHAVLVERGLNSVSPTRIFTMFAAEGATVATYDEVRELDLKICDRTVPRRKERYIALGALEGVASSLAVTGAEVSATVSGGTTLTVAVAAIVADVSTVMAGMGRIVALVAAHYGYDVREPDEQVFASGVIAYSAAGNSVEKAAALASLSRLTQQMMRRATWRQLQQHQLVTVIQRVVTSLGFNLTKRKLAQAVPVLGAVINGGLNARIAYQTFDRAQQAYRLRFLTEKYDLDPARWAPPVIDVEPLTVPLVDEMLDEELRSARDDDR